MSEETEDFKVLIEARGWIVDGKLSLPANATVDEKRAFRRWKEAVYDTIQDETSDKSRAEREKEKLPKLQGFH